MSGERYELKKKSGKVLIVRNQIYHRDHSGDTKPEKDCSRCQKDTRGASHDVLKRIEEENVDVQDLVGIFTELGFTDIYGGTDQFVQKDKSKREMIELLKLVAQQDFSDDYCFICVILSYGKDGVITCIDDSRDGNSELKTATPSMMLPVSELQECLKGDKCQGLLMKPKIFILQLEAVPTDAKDAIGDREAQPPKPVKIPREADFLIYNCETNYAIKAWIKGLTEHVKDKKEPLEIQRLLVRMNNMVRSYYHGEGISNIELPCVTSLLTKEVYLGSRIQQ